LILQPIVENAVKHGISPLRRGGTISIRARVEPALEGDGGDCLRLSVRDTGAGYDISRGVAGRQGVGLENVESRLLRYYGGRDRLRITSSRSTGTVVTLTLPVMQRRALAGVP
jgi:sensor histidine kinase YesM